MLLLITRPKHDPENHYLYYWGKLLIEEAQRRGLKYFDLEKERANRKNVLSYLKKRSPDIVILNGHGDEQCVMGQDNEVLLHSGDTQDVFEDKTFFIRACSAGKTLGPASIAMKAKGFIGYKKAYRFWQDSDSLHEPLNDKFAKPFEKTSNQVAVSLIKGKSAPEAHDDSLKVYNQEILKLLNSGSDNSFVIADLLWNRAHQVCLT